MTTVPPPAASAWAAPAHGRWARPHQVAVWVLIGLAALVFLVGLGIGMAQGAGATAVVLPRWTTGTVAPILMAWGLPAGAVVAYLLLLECVTFGLGAVAAAVLLRRPWSGFRVYVAVVVVFHTALGGAAPLLVASLDPGLAWASALTGLGWFGLFSLLLVFPDGRFVPGWMRWTVPAWAAVFVGALAQDTIAAAPVVLTVALLVLLVIGLAAQVVRYRRAENPEVRRQTRWVLAAFGARVGLLVCSGLFWLIRPTSEPTAAALAFDLAVTGASYLISALVALTLAVAVVRHRLFGADVTVSRTVVYAALTVFLLLLFALVVGGIGLLWRNGGVILPVVATATAAATLVPVRGWLQRRVARLVYGDRAEPQKVVRELAQRLSLAGEPSELLRSTVQLIGPAIGLARVSIVMAERTTPLATYRRDGPPGVAAVFPIDHQGRHVGALEVVAFRGEPLTGSDRELLAAVAGQAGLAVLAAEASEAAVRARQEAVSAREEERRRMHRDLHDGLGPTLASIYQRVELAARQVEDAGTRQLLTDTGDQVRKTVGEVRRLVHGLRPTRLDDLGLVEAVRASCEELSGPDQPEITLWCPEPLPELRAIVETAAYRIALESVTNTVRHAEAGTCRVEFVVAATGVLAVTVRDDGVGLSQTARPGMGITSLRERAAEAGGTLTIETVPGRGTVIRADLPLEPRP